jgi:hypothetical protein
MFRLYQLTDKVHIGDKPKQMAGLQQFLPFAIEKEDRVPTVRVLINFL